MPLFKHIVVFRIGPDWAPPALERLEAELQRLAFNPCLPAQDCSIGWLPPRGEDHGAMVELVGGQWILQLAVERKAVPGTAVRAELDARCKALEHTRGRKPGRREREEIKQAVVHALLPRAFGRRATHVIWLDPAERRLVLAASSPKAAEPVVKALLDVMAALGHAMPLAPLGSVDAPAVAMSHWLASKEAPAGFSIDRDLELAHPGESKSVVRYARHDLERDEIGQHIREGKLPTRLALTWNARVSFELTEALSLRKIQLLDVGEAPQGEDGFDADVAIATGELSSLLHDLLACLGGERVDTLAPSAVAVPATVDRAETVDAPF